MHHTKASVVSPYWSHLKVFGLPLHSLSLPLTNPTTFVDFSLHIDDPFRTFTSQFLSCLISTYFAHPTSTYPHFILAITIYRTLP